MQSKGIFLCLVRVKVWLSEGLSMETVMIQWGYWRVMWRWGCRLAKGRSHTHALCPPGSHAERDGSGACIWGAAPGRHTDELMKRYAVRLAGVGAWRVWREGIPAINHPGWSWDPLLLDEPDRGEGTWGQGHIKGIECPPPPNSAWEGGDGVKGERLRG